MSFITKRERVFNEYELYDLPSRNEGKLKAYSSCTDTRAWSHYSSDQAEHLVEVIKRNNEICRPKYIPTHVIVDMLMVGKNNEIERLKGKITEFEDMLKCYDKLDLTCEQKCDIAKEHAAIRAANKELDDLFLDLNMSELTEGMDSEGFQTGKSSGDEACKCTPRSKDEWSGDKEPKRSACAQAELKCDCDATTMVTDPRIDEMKDTIITKDAKLNAMHNTIAVMENDVCEPYCIYAHIYTALEKIFGILCQNRKYKLYLDLMTSGRDTRCIDIKGKILFKLKILEKFSLALVAPCSPEMCCPQPRSEPESYCYRADTMSRNHVETTFALTSTEVNNPSSDRKRTQLVADIMENDEMKEIMCKEDCPSKADCLTKADFIIDDYVIEDYVIETENLKRLKQLQENYDDLMTCYESLKHEKDCLLIRCRKYEEMEKEMENLQCQLREYNSLWNEKEHYRKRSIDLDSLKEQYLVLSNETCNLETELKAEGEVNYINSKTIEELRKENLTLERKLNEAYIAFEKDKNSLQCKIKECECKEMCQDQQIKTLSVQIDRLLEQDTGKNSARPEDLTLLDDINSQREQIQNLKDLLCENEDEKQQLQDDYQNKLNLINSLKMEIEDWKSNYEKTLQRNDYLEKYSDDIRDEMRTLVENNEFLTREIKDKTDALENIIDVLNNKSLEVNTLMETIEQKNNENCNLYDQIQTLKHSYQRHISDIGIEKADAMNSLQIARQESQELLEKVKMYADKSNKQEELSRILQTQSEEYSKLKLLLESTQEENRNILQELKTCDYKNFNLQQEIDRLREMNISASNNISNLQDENNQHKLSLQQSRQDSKILDDKLQRYEDLSLQLRNSHERLLDEKQRLENELERKTLELVTANQSIQINRTHSQELLNRLQQSENAQSDLSVLNDAYQRIIGDKEALQRELSERKKEFDDLLNSFQKLQNQNQLKCQEVGELTRELKSLKATYNKLLTEKNALQNNYDDKTEEFYNALESKVKENRDLHQHIELLEKDHKSVTNDINQLKAKHSDTQAVLSSLRRHSDELSDKVKDYNNLGLEYDKLKSAHEKSQAEKNNLKRELELQMSDLRKIQNENYELNTQSQTLLSHSEDLENALMTARNELIAKVDSVEDHSTSILKEIEQLKREKFLNQKKIADLLNKLEQSESVISKLTDDVLTRDHNIAELENHINELQNEVQRLHETLSLAIDTGEDVSNNTVKSFSDSLQSIEAHHSKATHNMRMELAKLKSQNAKLEEQLSSDKVKSTEFDQFKNKYTSQIMNLENEREIIITDIKQLEIRSVGDSALLPDKCDTEHILNSLDRIGQYLDNLSSKTSTQEQSLLKMQNLNHVVQSKADKATKIVENEKQKIITEKEEAIRDKINMEKELKSLREQLQNQTSRDKAVIKDLEAEILNQKLIIDKLNKSTQSYINKLEDEMKTLQNLYKNALGHIAEIENQLKSMNDEHAKDVDIIGKANKYLEEKCMEIGNLRKQLSELQKPQCQEISTQTQSMVLYQDAESQTDKIMREEQNIKKYEKDDPERKLLDSKQRSRNIHQKNKSKPLNAVQILTAQVDSNLDYNKSDGSNHKQQQVSGKELEQYSSSNAGPSNHKGAVFDKHFKPGDEQDLKRTKKVSYDDNAKVVDIYKKTIDTSSLKDNYEINTKDLDRINQNNISRNLNEFSDSNISEANIENQFVYSTSFDSASIGSTDKDLFVIYHDSDSAQDNLKNTQWQNRQSKILVEAVTVQPKHQILGNRQEDRKHNQRGNVESDSLMGTDDLDEDDSVKEKLKIDLPRVDMESQSVDNSEIDQKSLDSYTLAIYSTPKDSSHYKTTEGSSKLRRPQTESLSVGNSNYATDLPSTKPKDKTKKKINYNQENEDIAKTLTKTSDIAPESDYKLSRVGSDVLLLEGDYVDKSSHKKSRDPNNTDFALDYILSSVEQEGLDNFRTYDAANALRKARSDERFDNVINILEHTDSSPARLSKVIKSSSVHPKSPTIGYSLSKTSENSETKSYNERSVMANLDSTEIYEDKIRRLSNTLETIQKDYKKKIDVIKTQYDNNIKCLINEHNQGVQSIQSLHEETLHDIIKMHENEVENWRSMSIDAMRKADILEKENQSLKSKIDISLTGLDEEPIKIPPPKLKKWKKDTGTKMLTKTMIEAFNVKPKRSHGPCTCSLGINLSDTIRNIFEQVDSDQRKLAEHTYLKYIANKILGTNLESLDTQELSFLHFKVCRIWKTKINKEETLQKRIDSLETELLNKQKHTQQNIAALDLKVAEERRRLQEVREAVCRHSPTRQSETVEQAHVPPATPAAGVKISCFCNQPNCRLEICERRSAGDLSSVDHSHTIRPKRARTETNRAVLAKLDAEERKERKMTDETPTRLRKPHDRLSRTPKK